MLTYLSATVAATGTATVAAAIASVSVGGVMRGFSCFIDLNGVIPSGGYQLRLNSVPL